MVNTRPATPAAGVIAFILVGGAVATAVATIMMFFSGYASDILRSFRTSTGYYVISCVLVGLFTGAGALISRPRGPLAPIAAAITAFGALYVGNRFGVIALDISGSIPDPVYFTALMKYHFDVEDLLAPLIAAGLAGLRVMMVAKSLPPSRPAGPPRQPAPGPGWAPGGPQGGPPPHGGG